MIYTDICIYNEDEKMKKLSMIDYISNQDNALINTMECQSLFTEPFKRLFMKYDIKRIYILGSGTSYHASIAGMFYFEKYTDIDTIADIPTRFTNYTKIKDSTHTLVIGISQSGTSVSTIQAIRKAVREGCITVAITDDMESLITNETEHIVKLTCGKEEIPIETRGYTVTLLELFLIAVSVGNILGKLSDENYKEIQKNTATTLKNYTLARETVEDWYERNHEELQSLKKGVIAAYGVNQCTYLEGVLKMFETFKHPMNGYDIEEMIHGPQMAFNSDMWIFLIASRGAEYVKIPLFLKFFRDNQITEHLFVITDGDVGESNKDIHFVPIIEEDLSPLFYILPFQIMAARNCIAAGIETSVMPAYRRAFAHYYSENERHE